MLAQISAKVRPLAGSELHQLERDINSALYQFMNAGVPETLLHGDIGHGNIIATPNGPVFLDWAETYIGHPFLSAEHLLADFERTHPHLCNERIALRLAYADHWREYATPDAIANTVAFAPAIAAFAYAVMAWEANAQRPEAAHAWPLLRSMLRRTKLELEHMWDVAS